jgi:hypothetical protein
VSAERREQELKSATDFTHLRFSMNFLNFKDEFWNNTDSSPPAFVDVLKFINTTEKYGLIRPFYCENNGPCCYKLGTCFDPIGVLSGL